MDDRLIRSPRDATQELRTMPLVEDAEQEEVQGAL